MSEDHAAQTRYSHCPFCREQIVAGAIKCRHCSSTLVPVLENVRVGAFPAAQTTQIVNVVQPSLSPSDNGIGLGIFFSALAIFALLVIVSCLDAPDAKDEAVGSLILIGTPAIIGSIYILSKKQTGAIFSYLAIGCTALSFLLTVGLYS